MGNCQAIDAAALVIQHPCGKMDRLYWSVPVSEVMRMNPGHCISLIILLPDRNDNPEDETVRFTRVKLLRPGETLTLGHAYCLVTSHGIFPPAGLLFLLILIMELMVLYVLAEVMEVLRAKKYAKPKRQQHLESSEKLQHEQEQGNQSLQSQAAMTKHERRRPTIAPANAAAMSSKSWRPSLQSTSESST
ncbi:nucleobase-ascorbate transporter 7-like isoform X1 [Hibiscus syriacus]|uniref:Nucleobase-ascorbate transporter 7-like isoform X1 n=1 Tax=Hibiscus syriacus TaxID=106335 RepID=A0A6A3AP05_HIBSY|nr:nucleobase-ascorbate transporter 7-like isoform X1 [Hibiscus syriacus]